jgi:hypothetical protein
MQDVLKYEKHLCRWIGIVYADGTAIHFAWVICNIGQGCDDVRCVQCEYLVTCIITTDSSLRAAALVLYRNAAVLVSRFCFCVLAWCRLPALFCIFSYSTIDFASTGWKCTRMRQRARVAQREICCSIAIVSELSDQVENGGIEGNQKACGTM